MSVHRMRRGLVAEPRWMIAMLLAFALETLPGAAVVTHRHGAGAVDHGHVGPLVHADAAPTRPIGDGLTRAPSRDLHRHVGTVVLAVRTPLVVAAGPPTLARSVFVRPVIVPAAAPAALGHARAPPALDV
jgi:hypothetical protein